MYKAYYNNCYRKETCARILKTLSSKAILYTCTGSIIELSQQLNGRKTFPPLRKILVYLTLSGDLLRVKLCKKSHIFVILCS